MTPRILTMLIFYLILASTGIAGAQEPLREQLLREAFSLDSLGCHGLRWNYLTVTSSGNTFTDSTVLIGGHDFRQKPVESVLEQLGSPNLKLRTSEGKQAGIYTLNFTVDKYIYFLNSCSKEPSKILKVTAINGYVTEIVIEREGT